MSGVGRAATTAAAYLISTGLTADEAWAVIRRVRPFVRPSDTQLSMLKEFQRSHRGPGHV